MKKDPLVPQASSAEMKELLALIESRCSDFQYWKTKVRSGYGIPVNMNTNVPQAVSQILVMCQNSKGNDVNLLKNIGKLTENKHSANFQWLHSIFRGRDDATNNFYGILAQLDGPNASRQSVVCKVIQDLKTNFPEPSNESTALIKK